MRVPDCHQLCSLAVTKLSNASVTLKLIILNSISRTLNATSALNVHAAYFSLTGVSCTTVLMLEQVVSSAIPRPSEEFVISTEQSV